jgi:hypothetical protein
MKILEYEKYMLNRDATRMERFMLFSKTREDLELLLNRKTTYNEGIEFRQQKREI